jgi:hypothetical protein
MNNGKIKKVEKGEECDNVLIHNRFVNIEYTGCF